MGIAGKGRWTLKNLLRWVFFRPNRDCAFKNLCRCGHLQKWHIGKTSGCYHMTWDRDFQEQRYCRCEKFRKE